MASENYVFINFSQNVYDIIHHFGSSLLHQCNSVAPLHGGRPQIGEAAEAAWAFALAKKENKEKKKEKNG